jgi:hypothetical protein
MNAEDGFIFVYYILSGLILFELIIIVMCLLLGYKYKITEPVSYIKNHDITIYDKIEQSRLNWRS